jgi:uncharacterized protein (TIGR04141 family)
MADKHSLTIYLAKRSVTTLNEAIKDISFFTENSISINGAAEACLYYKSSPSTEPKWTKLFQDRVDLSTLRNRSSSAILAVKCSERIFFVTFGYGWTSLNPSLIEQNFGLKIVLNTVEHEKLRSIDAFTLETVSINQKKQTSKASGIENFNIDFDRDLVCSAAGQPRDKDLGSTISGRDSVKISTEVDLDNLCNRLTSMLEKYSADTYKEHFAWIDHISEIRNPDLIGTLDEKLLSLLRKNELENTWLSIPEVIEWHDFEGFRFVRKRQAELVDDLSLAEYLADELEDKNELTIGKLKHQQIFCISSSSESPTHSWPIYKCLYSEITEGNTINILNNGKWYQVENTFLQSLDGDLQNIHSSSITLPECPLNSNEDSYNESVANNAPDEFACMDQNFIYHGGGHSKIEFCDLYSTEKHIVHVKKYGGASVLSHLFNQGVVSGELFVLEKDFRDKVNERLPDRFKLEDTALRPNSGDYEVVYAFISSAGQDPIKLPLFSKITFRQAHRTLTAMGYKVTQKVIHQRDSQGATVAETEPQQA